MSDLNSCPPGAAGSRSPRRRQRLSARLARRDAALLQTALSAGTLALKRCQRVRLADAAPVVEECWPHWTRAGHPVSAALLAAKGTAPVAAGRWMLLKACEGPGPVSVPLPPALLTPQVLAELEPVIAGGGTALEVRVPETALLAPSTDTLLVLSGMRDLGVGLVLADFGMRVGAACLLRDLPLTGVQLDPGLTHEAGLETEAGAFVAGLAGLAHSQRLTVIARAVTGPAHAAALWRLGVDAGTGPGLPAA